MRAKIHPKFYPDAKVSCACGNTFTTGSTKPELTVEICSACHPFFTGKAKLIDTAGRVDRFKARLQQSQKLSAAAQKRLAAKEQKALAEQKAQQAAKKTKQAPTKKEQ